MVDFRDIELTNMARFKEGKQKGKEYRNRKIIKLTIHYLEKMRWNREN
jgi:hypothetical protein